MSATERLRSEQAFHDRQAGERAHVLAARADLLRVEEDAYLNHETWIRPALEQLGPLAGRRVLDYGCGHGMAAVVLARRGAAVTAFDLSAGYLAEARRRAAVSGVRVAFVAADGHRLPFADAAFDRVWGNAVLHHLDLPAAAAELHRVLRPGGLAVFCEPWGDNPLLRWARRRLPYPQKGRTPGEEPLRGRDLAALRGRFGELEVRGFQLLSMVRRLGPPAALVAALDRCDRLLLSRVPALQRFCRYAVLTLRRSL